MELAIPIIALVGLIAIKTRKEKFKTMGKNPQYLPNVNEPLPNYPKVAKDDSVNHYPDSHAATDKYFTQSMYQKQAINENVKQVQSLSGNYIDRKDFTHENMTPFYTTKMGSSIGISNILFILEFNVWIKSSFSYSFVSTGSVNVLVYEY